MVQNLARFRPTKVAVERPSDGSARQWAEYRAGGLTNSRNEVVQLGFRLARLTGSEVLGIDAAGEFPFGPVAKFAQKNGQALPHPRLVETSCRYTDSTATQSVGSSLVRYSEAQIGSQKSRPVLNQLSGSRRRAADGLLHQSLAEAAELKSPRAQARSGELAADGLEEPPEALRPQT